MSIQVSGLEEVIEKLDNANLTEELERELLTYCDIILDEIVQEQPVLTGSQKRGWSGKIKRLDGKRVYVISCSDWTYMFSEYGTSFANHKKVGYVARAIENNIEEVRNKMLDRIAKELDFE